MFKTILGKVIVYFQKADKHRIQGGEYMTFLRWLGGIVLLFWALGFAFRIAGSFIHLLLLVAVGVFIYDLISGNRRRRVK
jgi:hypothetical protein